MRFPYHIVHNLTHSQIGKIGGVCNYPVARPKIYTRLNFIAANRLSGYTWSEYSAHTGTPHVDIELSQDDFQRLTRILAGMEGWRDIQSRLDLPTTCLPDRPAATTS
jgi:hypothetical protein